MTWTKDYSGHYTAKGKDNTYVLTSNQKAGWTLVIIDRITELAVARHREARKLSAIDIAAHYELSDQATQVLLRSEFRA
jgi:hypothetical protein